MHLLSCRLCVQLLAPNHITPVPIVPAANLSFQIMFAYRPDGFRLGWGLRNQVQLIPGDDEIEHELYNYRETCFVKTTAQFFLRQITLEVYFDRIIGHLADGARRHTFDRAGCELGKLLRIDIISGAIKFQMLNESFRRLDAVGTLGVPSAVGRSLTRGPHTMANYSTRHRKTQETYASPLILSTT